MDKEDRNDSSIRRGIKRNMSVEVQEAYDIVTAARDKLQGIENRD
jgi:hypothetical protein